MSHQCETGLLRNKYAVKELSRRKPAVMTLIKALSQHIVCPNRCYRNYHRQMHLLRCVQVCVTALMALGSIIRAVEASFAPFFAETMQLLLAALDDSEAHISIKAQVVPLTTVVLLPADTPNLGAIFCLACHGSLPCTWHVKEPLACITMLHWPR